MTDDYLTPSELRELTGRAHRANQLAWLKSSGWPHEVNGANRILVLRAYRDARMSGIDPKTPTAHAHKSHNFAALAPIDWLKANWHQFRFTAEEIVSRSSTYDPRIAIETECGIYFLIEGNSVVYVGQSIYVDSRLAEHHKSGKKFDRVFTFELPDQFLNIVESHYINTLMPALNEKVPIWREKLQ